ncbi:hypothetical protein Taro_035749 [Colocasia esculenta]|uniref:BHLH domain-containing protein n=1 Tax=Colocasia esculenta TaxID=4460 RepID=A0A843WBD3_COLES|nr:hypothetical protein [Colocasia esculenta]
MGLDDGGDFWSGQRGGGSAEKKMTMSSMAACRAEDPPPSVASNVFSANIAEQVLMGDWNLFVSMAQHMDFSGFTVPSSSGACVQANEWIGASGGSLTAQVASLPGFNDGGISQIMSSTSLSANGQIAGPLCAADLNASDEHGEEKDSKGKKRRKLPEHDAFGSQSPLSRIQTAEAEQKKEVISGSAKIPIEEDVKKEKGEQKPRASTHKPTSKQAKENSSKGDADKEDYIHLRAKRGHATNSHSLAERVRRQKISERMKFLQDLVPGCSKITGKAVMLDEIINYIQSLQHQVEFLSMKLATVNPEVNLDIEKIVSKEVFYSQMGGSDALGF